VAGSANAKERRLLCRAGLDDPVDERQPPQHSLSGHTKPAFARCAVHHARDYSHPALRLQVNSLDRALL
jgi:hypothetical protein